MVVDSGTRHRRRHATCEGCGQPWPCYVQMAHGRRGPSDRLVELFVMAVLLGGVAMAASGFGQLLSAMWDTVWQLATGR